MAEQVARYADPIDQSAVRNSFCQDGQEDTGAIVGSQEERA